MAVLKTLSCTGASDSWIRLISLKRTAAAILSRRWCVTCMVCMKNGYKYHDPWSANGGLARSHWELGLELADVILLLVVLLAPWEVSGRSDCPVILHRITFSYLHPTVEQVSVWHYLPHFTTALCNEQHRDPPANSLAYNIEWGEPPKSNVNNSFLMYHVRPAIYVLIMFVALRALNL